LFWERGSLLFLGLIFGWAKETMTVEMIEMKEKIWKKMKRKIW
jgi:hypothetical protein